MTMAKERLSPKEDQPIWNSRLFKIGLATAAIGALVGAGELMTVGVVATGAAWALWSKKN